MTVENAKSTEALCDIDNTGVYVTWVCRWPLDHSGKAPAESTAMVEGNGPSQLWRVASVAFDIK